MTDPKKPETDDEATRLLGDMVEKTTARAYVIPRALSDEELKAITSGPVIQEGGVYDFDFKNGVLETFPISMANKYEEYKRLKAENAALKETLAIKQEGEMAKDFRKLLSERNALSAENATQAERIAKLEEALRECVKLMAESIYPKPDCAQDAPWAVLCRARAALGGE